ncbi:transcriptional regulator, TetR family [Saccharopolyspora kobensis]|uniref:Transcriptional regulator, TetR family n=1 Tax=Saccharopolyspora kobensis TaxID=146035 RepID=A0A1H6D607_9PSEU|nr:TetR/AcrR family transcriptional regulator [Saccharopolyspora kobensis]SEG80770.1 transcriptional regulator, TetR family [Saccharopolyspora kobensis]SFD13188.1 transcriptional regulator, TetR family [Saccharopolyspora kobensis]
MATRARERLVEAAEQLFYTEGIRAVGVERLVAVSGVGRASFYRHFSSKDDLVVTMLRGYDERFRSWLAEAVEARGGGPLAVFDALADRFEAADFRGCASINTMVEMADVDSAAHRVAAEHKEKVIDYLDELLAAAGQARHRELAEQFMLLVDGANVTALRERTAEPARRARSIAESLMDS